MRTLALLLLASCIGAPDRATLSGGHGWGGSDGEIGGVKGFEEDGSSNWVGAGLEFPIRYEEKRVDACARCERLETQIQELRAEVSRRPERASTEGSGLGGLWLGSGSVAALGALLAALMRYGAIPTIQPKEKACEESEDQALRS